MCCLQEAHEAIRPTDPLLSAKQLVAHGGDPSAAKLYGCDAWPWRRPCCC